MTRKTSLFNKKYSYLALLITIITISSCRKYVDKPAQNIDFNSLYCNDPSAINYNWGFPGKPDNSKCIYPTDIFKGTYSFSDSIVDAFGVKTFSALRTIQLDKVNDSVLNVTGLCGSSVYKAKATKNYRFSLDTTAVWGQPYCTNNDTISGTAAKFYYNDSNFEFRYFLINDTTKITHQGVFIKQ